MSVTNNSEIFCRYEIDNFPSGEFSDDPDWGKVHDAKPPHTVHGAIIGHKATGPGVEAADNPDDEQRTGESR